jgi:hypothetical protein
MSNLDWKTIRDNEQLNSFLDLTKGLHDAITINSWWEGAEYLTPSRHLVLDGFGTLLLEVVSQFADVPALELRFEKVEKFRYSYGGDTEPVIEFSRLGIRTKLLEWEIEAASFCYRVAKSNSSNSGLG